MIGILDLGMGNLRSLSNAIQHNGFDVQVTEDQTPFDDFTHLIIPGVGHFRAAMAAVAERDLRPHIQAFAATGNPATKDVDWPAWTPAPLTTRWPAQPAAR